MTEPEAARHKALTEAIEWAERVCTAQDGIAAYLAETEGGHDDRAMVAAWRAEGARLVAQALRGLRDNP